MISDAAIFSENLQAQAAQFFSHLASLRKIDIRKSANFVACVKKTR